MSYSVTAILQPYQDARGMHQVSIQIIHNRIKLYPPTEIKVKVTEWKKGAVINHPLKDKYNHIIQKRKIELEGCLLEAMKYKSEFSKEDLQSILLGKTKTSFRFDEFAYSHIDEMKNKLSPGRIKHYRVIINKVLEYDHKTLVSQINGAWLQKFENWLHAKKLLSNTINSNIKIIKAIVRIAEAKGIISEVNFKGYKNPKITASEPDFLNEEELQKFFAVARAINQPAHKLAAYYFLLSCFTGLRIGDAKRFNYQTHVIGDEIIVRAKKNGKLVTIPLYTDLSEVLDYLHDKPFILSEEKARQYVKEISSLAGIKKRVKYHTSRHTATTRLIQKGFNAKEVSEIIGDSVDIINKVYSHIDKENLRLRVKQLLG